MWLHWDAALVLAVGLVAFGVPAHRASRRPVVVAGAFAREAALVLTLYAVWVLAGRLAVMQVDGALDRGRWIWDAEQALHLPSELAIQRAALPYPEVVRASNVYYAMVHVPALIAFLVWLFTWHRDRYPPVRNVIAISTAACLAIQLLPVAPPRLMESLGFVDTARLYGQSVYGSNGIALADQLSAMPSVHVLWALIIGIAVVTLGVSRWRWVIVAHPVLTAVVVVVTANHWWLDGIVALAVLGIAWAAERSVRAVARRLHRGSAAQTSDGLTSSSARPRDSGNRGTNSTDASNGAAPQSAIAYPSPPSGLESAPAARSPTAEPAT